MPAAIQVLDGLGYIGDAGLSDANGFDCCCEGTGAEEPCPSVANGQCVLCPDTIAVHVTASSFPINDHIYQFDCNAILLKQFVGPPPLTACLWNAQFGQACIVEPGTAIGAFGVNCGNVSGIAIWNGGAHFSGPSFQYSDTCQFAGPTGTACPPPGEYVLFNIIQGQLPFIQTATFAVL